MMCSEQEAKCQLLPAERSQCTVTVQDVQTTFDACEVELPEGIDILLGDSWQIEHRAVLLPWQGLVNFIDDNGIPAVWTKQQLKSKLKLNPFNSPLKWDSAATVSNRKTDFCCSCEVRS